METLTNVSKDDLIIVVMGYTGCGKTNFIEKASGQGKEFVNASLISQSPNLRTFFTPHPVTGKRVVFVDTPGFDGTTATDFDALYLIAEWLNELEKHGAHVGGVLYLHQITDNRVTNPARENIERFLRLCGGTEGTAMRNVIIVTTMWDNVDTTLGDNREQELKEDFWGSIIENGGTTKRFLNTEESAWVVLGDLAKRSVSLQIKEELKANGNEVDQKTVVQRMLLSFNPFKNPVGSSRIPISPDYQISPTDKIVVVMGPTGAGKSTFINHATGGNGDGIGHGLKSCTESIKVTPAKIGNDVVAFVDTPGFGDTYKSDLEIATIIADFFKKLQQTDLKISCILYLHRMTDNRVDSNAQHNLDYFKTLCGKMEVSHVILVTTMWTMVDKGMDARLQELKNAFWQKIIEDGGKVKKFEDSQESALDIIDLSPSPPKRLATSSNHPTNAAYKHPLPSKHLTMSSNYQINPTDKVVLVIGPLAAGKSTFINHATGGNGDGIYHGLGRGTDSITVTPAKIGDDVVAFVDTPGFAGSFAFDIEILGMIADFLEKLNQKRIKISCILYLYRITDSRMTGAALKHLEDFTSLCGRTAIPGITIVTTMWSIMDKAVAEERHQVLSEVFWRPLIADGCKLEKFEDSRESALRIIGSSGFRDVTLTEEVIEKPTKLKATEAGIALNKQLEKLAKDKKAANKRLRDLTRKQKNSKAREALQAEIQNLDQGMQEINKQLSSLKLSFSDVWRRLTSGRAQVSAIPAKH